MALAAVASALAAVASALAAVVAPGQRAEAAEVAEAAVAGGLALAVRQRPVPAPRPVSRSAAWRSLP